MWMSNLGYCTNEIMFCFDIYCRESLSHFVLACVMRRGRLRFNDQNSFIAARVYTLVPWAPPHSCSGQLQEIVPFSLLYATSHCSVTKPLQDLPYLQAHPSGFLASPLMLGETAFPCNPGKCLQQGPFCLPPLPFLGWDFPSHNWGFPKPPRYSRASLHCWEPPSPGSIAFLSLQAFQCYQPLLSWFFTSQFFLQAQTGHFISTKVCIFYILVQ